MHGAKNTGTKMGTVPPAPDSLEIGSVRVAHEIGTVSAQRLAAQPAGAVSARLVAASKMGTVPFSIPPQLLAAVCGQARAEFSAECCGYLTGPAGGDAVDALVPCRNAQAGGEHPLVPERGADAGFVIAGAELFAFAKSFDGPAPARIVYHSHTNGRAYFSDVDREMAAGPEGPAYPVQHLVVGLDAERITEVAQFAWSDEARDFVEVARWRP